MKAADLRVEYLYNPVGLGIAAPRFFWKPAGGKKQTAYQIRATRYNQEIWNTGKVASGEMTHIRWAGKALKSRDRVSFQVTLWDETDTPGEAASGFFELGLLKAGDWKGSWITGDYKPQKNTRYPADCFRKCFASKKGLVSARLYITACGLYEAQINGSRVGSFVLAPGSTDYRRRIQYQTYDVTDLVREQAENTLEITLADGWYRGSVGCFAPTNVFGRQTKLLCQLELNYRNGARQIIGSDSSFSWSSDGPVRFADLEDGEIIDAAQTPAFDGSAVVVKERVVPTASDNVPVTCHERLPGKLLHTPAGKTVLDFGQNLAGFVSFTVSGVQGKQLKLTMGEILDEAGEFTQKNMQEETTADEMSRMQEIMLITGNKEKLKCAMKFSPKQEIVYTCRGGREHYETRFAIFGFRYALVETDLDLSDAEFEAVAVYSDMRVTGSFTCSDERVNRLWQNTLWSMKSNFADVPTDCPTRERLGWTGDAQIFFRTGTWMMDTAAFFRKWLRDMADNQTKKGKMSAVVPWNGCSMVYDNTGASVGWGDAAILIPWSYYEAYGDLDVLQESYPMMQAYAEFMIRNTGHKSRKDAKANPYNQYVYEKGLHLGEWLEPEEFNETVTAGSSALHTEEATAYLHFSMEHMAKAAEVLGKTGDAARYREYADGAAKAYSWLFLRAAAPDTDRQAKLVRPLALGLGTEQERKALEDRLAEAVVSRAYHVMTGFLSTPYLLPVLTEAGRSDLAYKMLLNEEKPGWLYEVQQGATTIWENWEGTLSRNHYSPGAVCQWLMESAAGIRQNGKAAFVLAPVPAQAGITCAAGSCDTLYGKVESSWRIEGTEIIYHFIVPANCTAVIRLPGAEAEEVEAGSYERRQHI